MIILNKFKIRTKLVILTVFLAGCTFAVGLVGYTYAKDSHSALDTIYNQNLSSTILLSDVMNQTRSNYEDGMKLLRVSDFSEREIIEEDIDRRINTIESDLLKYKKTDFDTFESKQFNLIQSKIQEWNSEFEKIRDYSGTGRGLEAAVLFQTTAEAVFEDIQISARELVNYNIEEADTIYRQNAANDREAFGFLALLTASAILASLSAGMLITRSITEPIKSAAALINETTDPDLLFDSSHEFQQRYKGEIGMLINSIFKMRKEVREQIIDTESCDFAVNSQELPITSDAHAITIHPDLYTLNTIEEENKRQVEMNTVTEPKADTVNKGSSYNNIETGKDEVSLEETSVQPFNILSKMRKKVNLVPKDKTENPKENEEFQKGNEEILKEYKENLKEYEENSKEYEEILNDNEENAKYYTESPKDYTEKPESVPVSEDTVDVYSNLNELMLKVDNLKDLVYEITSQSNIFTLNAVTEVTRVENNESAGFTNGSEATSVSVDLIAATSARLAKLAEEIKDGAINLKY